MVPIRFHELKADTISASYKENILYVVLPILVKENAVYSPVIKDKWAWYKFHARCRISV